MAERTPRQQAWASHGLKEVGRAALRRFQLEIRPHLPKCNGTSRSTGLPCGNLAVPGKQKCRWHGGAVPSGDDWHKIQYPASTSKDWQRKLNEKLKRDERNRRRRERRLAKMTAEQRAKYEEWHRTHKAGSKAERARRRDDRKRAAEIRASLEKPDDRPVTPELAELRAQAAALEKARDHYRRLAEQQQQQQNEDRGVFS